VDLVALDHVAIDVAHVVVAARRDAGVLIRAELPAGRVGGPEGTPTADVVLLDDDIVLARLHHDAVLPALDGEAAHDDVVRRDADGDRLRGADVDHRARRRLVQHIAVGRSALRHVERARLASHGDGLRDRELLAPGRRDETGARGLAWHAELDLITR